MARRVLVVTGSNKGIGFEIVRALLRAQSAATDVVLTSRSAANGETAAAALRAEGLGDALRVRPLDIEDDASVTALRDWLRDEYGGLDVLVNNAGFAFKNAATEPFAEQAEVTTAINFEGTLRVCDALLPLLRPHARVVNVSSMAGRSCILGAALRARVLSPTLDVAALKALVAEFVAAAREGTAALAAQGWPNTAYGVSKVAVSALTRIHARELGGTGAAGVSAGVLVNGCCPGWCATDMAGARAPRTAEQGAETPAFLAMLPHDATHNGKFFSDKAEHEW